MFFTASNSFFMLSKVHRNGRKIRSAAGTSLAVLLGFVLFGLSAGRLYANDVDLCRACIKSFWHDVCYFRLTAFDHATDDFADFSPKGAQTNRTELSQSFSDHSLFSRSVKDGDFSAAHEYLKRIFSRHIVKNGKKDNRKYADLSPEEQKTARAQMQAMADGILRSSMQKNNSMQIRKLSISGEAAEAVITYSDRYFHYEKKLTLKRLQGKWKISKMEHQRSVFIGKGAPRTGNSGRTKSNDSRSQTDLQIDSDLLNAARSGNYEAAARAIANGADVNAKAAAIRRSDVGKDGSVKLKASANKSSKYEGVTVLHYAAGSNAGLTELLLRKDADVNDNVCLLGETPLHRAAWRGLLSHRPG